MRVEIRKSGGPACEHCGATELVLLQNGTPLERDIHALLNEENERLERNALALQAETAADLRADVDDLKAEVDRLVEAAISIRYGELLNKFERLHDQLADGVTAFMDDQQVPGYRLAKKRWHRKLSAELALAVDELRSQSRLV